MSSCLNITQALARDRSRNRMKNFGHRCTQINTDLLNPESLPTRRSLGEGGNPELFGICVSSVLICGLEKVGLKQDEQILRKFPRA